MERLRDRAGLSIGVRRGAGRGAGRADGDAADVRGRGRRAPVDVDDPLPERVNSTVPVSFQVEAPVAE